MTQTDFDLWLAYSDACNRLLAQTLCDAPQTFSAPFETMSNFRSIREIIAHIIGAEERWIKYRIQGETVPIIYEKRAAETIDGIFADANAIRAQTRAYLATLTSADLDKTIELNLPQLNYQGTLTIAEVLFHILTHETHHRGQIVMALQRQGIDSPNFDYVLLGK